MVGLKLMLLGATLSRVILRLISPLPGGQGDEDLGSVFTHFPVSSPTQDPNCVAVRKIQPGSGCNNVCIYIYFSQLLYPGPSRD